MKRNDFVVRPASWENERSIIMSIRREVFIQEQQVPEEMEWDGRDESALHVLAFFGGKAVETGRLLFNGQIGRMAVCRDWRNRGIGTAILQELVKISREKKIICLFLNAQVQAVEFYRKQGFTRKEGFFEEAGIVHCRMEYQEG